MRSFLSRLIVLAVATVGLGATVASPTSADVRCEHVNPVSGQCVVSVGALDGPGSSGPPASPGATDSGAGSACYWDPSKQGLSAPPAGAVPCTSPTYGYWSNAHNCYIQAAKPQPPAGDPDWQGHEPGDGAVYSCYQPQTDMFAYFWSATAPPGPGPTPGDVAQLAIKKMGLRAIDIGIAPKPGPNSVGLVGMPVWMWAQSPSDATYGPTTATASAGGVAVTATAKVGQITWDMGDGTKVVCDSPGTPYQPSYGQKSSPDCGHTYTKSSVHQSSGKYTVTATSEWVITWSGAGQTGTIRLAGLTRSTQIKIGEAQVLVN